MLRGPDTVTAIARVTALLSAGPWLWGCSPTVRSSARKEKKGELLKHHGKGEGNFFFLSHMEVHKGRVIQPDVCRESRTKNFDLRPFLPYKLFLHVTTASNEGGYM